MPKKRPESILGKSVRKFIEFAKELVGKSHRK